MKLPTRFVVLAALTGTLLSAQAADSKSDSWRNVPLIKDGKLSPDWVQIGYGYMAIDGDAIRTEPAPQGLGLFTYRKEKLGNCQIRVVFKAKDQRANAGVYVRIADGILDQVKKPGAPFDRDASGKIS